MTSELIKVSKDVEEKLVRIAGELQYKKGEKVSLDETIKFLIYFYVRYNKEGVEGAEKREYKLFDVLSKVLTKLGDVKPEKIDKIIYDEKS